MDPDEHSYIQCELMKRHPDLFDEDEDSCYTLCYKVYNALNRNPMSWSLQEFVDADTLEHKWYWRKKQ